MEDSKHTKSQSTSSILDTIRKRRRLVENGDSRFIAEEDHSTVEQQTQEQFQTAAEEEDDNAAGQIVASEAVEAHVQLIRDKMERFTRQVSGLLEAGKNFFMQISNEFEEHIVLVHQTQIDKWQEEVQLLGTIDSLNEDMNSRLHDAQYLLRTVQMDS